MNLTRDRYFIEVAKLTAQRSTCLRGQVGALIVKDKRIVSTGYNGAPPGMPHCTPHNCNPHIDGCTNSIHAEKNAIAFAARYGVAIEGATMWSTSAPCLPCAQLIVSAGIVEFCYLHQYRDNAGIELLDNAGLTILQFRGF